jgi:hypothetical protein
VLRSLINLVLCAVPFLPVLSAETLTCPASIKTTQQLSSPVAGWKTSLDDAPQRLASVTFFDGPPTEQASLVYDDVKNVDGKRTATWRFNLSSARAIWLACQYSGTSVVLRRSLPRTVSTCAVTYSHTAEAAGLPAVESMHCR